MDEARVLLVDVRQYKKSTTVQETLEGLCKVSHADWTRPLSEAVAACEPCAIFFDYDFPDVHRLAALTRARQECSGVPVVMCTEEHSEALAVWALRNRVWDYLVKPVDPLAVGAAIRTLYRISLHRYDGATRHMVMPSISLPSEARFRGRETEVVNLEAATRYVEKNLSQTISQREAAAACGLSPYQFSRAFRREYGRTFQEYVMEQRLEQARRLLRNQAASVTDVCWAVGFRDVSYFGRMFKRRFAATPSAFRNEFAMAREHG